MALMSDYTVYSWGSDNYGQLGLGGKLANTPVMIESLKDIKITKIALGASSSLFLSDKGELYGCGYNEQYSLALETSEPPNIPQLVKFFEKDKVVKVIVGGYRAFAFTESCSIYRWGYNFFGQNVFPAAKSKFISQPLEFLKFPTKKLSIVLGPNTTFFITADKIYSCGANQHGENGTGDITSRSELKEIEFFSGKKILQLAIKEHQCACIIES